MKVQLILVTASLLFLGVACADAERIASPQVDGCKVVLKVSPDRPRAGFDSEIAVSAACPDRAGAEMVLTAPPSIKIFSDADSDRQILAPRAAGMPGNFVAPVVFQYGGRYLVTYDSGAGDKPVHRLFSVLVEGFPDGGSR